MYQIYRHASGLCEIRVDLAQQFPENLSVSARRAFMRVSSSLEVVNTWLTALAADRGYNPGTGYEYAKVCRYTLEWLTQNPVQLGPQKRPVGHSLLTLTAADARALDAYLNIPASEEEDRKRLCKTGQLPPRYRTYGVGAATRKFRRVVLCTFYEWVLTEYIPDDESMLTITRNPFKRRRRSSPTSQERPQSGVGKHRSTHTSSQSKSTFRTLLDEKAPDALTPVEIQLVSDAIPKLSTGHNAANRNGAMIRLLLWGLLRESELINLTWECIDEQVLRIQGKGGKIRKVPLADSQTWAFLDAYTNELRIPLRQRFHGPVFRQIDHEEQPITLNVMEHLMDQLKIYFRRQAERAADPNTQRHLAGLADRLHSHIFRATGATLMAAYGMDLLKLASLMGHSDPVTTKRYYIAADQLALSEEVQRIFTQVEKQLENQQHRPYIPPDPLRWYRQRGLLSPEGGLDG